MLQLKLQNMPEACNYGDEEQDGVGINVRNGVLSYLPNQTQSKFL